MMNIGIRLLLAAASMFAVEAALAQSVSPAFPSKAIRMVVALPPGGSNDILARVVAQGMTDAWGQPAIVENRPGANSIIAIEQLLRAPPDGHTLLVGGTTTYSINPFAYKKLPYDPWRDMAPITMLANLPLLVAVHPSIPAKSVLELIALAKSRPGELNYGSPSIIFHVIAETFSQQAGIRLTHVPYKGGVPTVTGLMAGDVQLSFIAPAPSLAHIKSGKLRALAITSSERAPYLPDLPTVAESGLPGYETVVSIGLFTRAGPPREVISRIQAEVARTLRAPAVRERLTPLGINPVGNSPEAFTAFLRRESARFGPVIKAANIRAD